MTSKNTNTKDKSSNINKAKYKARLDNQKAQLERHGNFAEVVIRTTPEGTDMINFARLWEHIMLQADRKTRGYVPSENRADFDQTQADYKEAMEFMASKLSDCIERHGMDLTGSNFISRVAQRYKIASKNSGGKKAKGSAINKLEDMDAS